MRRDYYNTDNFPVLIAANGPWNIYANAAGKCAAIPTEQGSANGHLASHYGDLRHVKKTLGVDTPAPWPPRHAAEQAKEG